MSEKPSSQGPDAGSNQEYSISIPLPQELDTPESRLNPFPWFKEMRQTDPVRYDPYRDVWDIFRYEDIKQILETGPPEWSSSMRPASELEGTEFAPLLNNIFRDPPVHDRIRGALEEFFEPEAIREYRDKIRRVAKNQVETTLANQTEFDFRQDLIKPIPVNTICSLFGVPLEKREDIREWSRSFVSAQRTEGDTSGVSDEKRAENMLTMLHYFESLIEEKRAEPSDDILSALIAKDMDGEPLTNDELKGIMVFTIVAGNTTTINSLTSAVWTLAEQGRLENFTNGRYDRQLLLDEVLRYRGPAKAISRSPTEDVEIRGETIPAGERCELWLLSANRDETVFDDPESFVPDRRPNPHMAFGRGIHYCLGAPLFRLEADVTLDVLLANIDGMDVDTGNLEPLNSFSQYGTRKLPVTVHPREDI